MARNTTGIRPEALAPVFDGALGFGISEINFVLSNKLLVGMALLMES